MGAPERLLPLASAWRMVASKLAEGFRPTPAVNVADWADENRVLPTKGAKEAGRWRTSRFPFLREIMDVLSPGHPAQEIILVKPSQSGGTAALTNAIGAYMDTQRVPILMVHPTLELGELWSKQTLAPMIESAPGLRAKIAPARSRDSGNTVLLKEWPGGVLRVAGANSPASMRQMPAMIAIGDDVDGWPDDLGPEGDPLGLMETRTTTFDGMKKVVVCSSPTTEKSSRVWRRYQYSDQRRYYVPCVHCGHRQTLEWEGLQWPSGQPEKAAYACAECGALMTERDKARLLAEGAWVAGHPDRKVVGFWWNALYLPPGAGMSWVDLADRWEKIRGDDSAIRVFNNVRLARVTAEAVMRVDWEEVKSRAEDYRLRTVPPGALILTMGVDVQINRLAVHVLGHGAGKRRWTIDYSEIPGDPLRPEVWDRLDEARAAVFHNRRGVPFRIANTAVDCSYLTDTVLAYVRPRQTRHVIAVRGASVYGKPIIAGRPSRVDYTVRGRAIPRGAEMWIVGSDTAKAELYAMLDGDRAHALAQDRLVHTSVDLDDAFFAGLTGEYYDADKRRWIKTRPNEALDTWCYAVMAAMHPSLRVHTWRPHQWDALAEKLEPDADLFTAPARVAEPAPEPVAPAPPAEATAPRLATYMDTLIAARRSRRHE